MLKSRLYLAAMAACILIGVIGVPLLTQVGCDQMYVKDPVTGEIRIATSEEEIELRAKIVAQGVATAETLAITTGHPEYVPLIGLAGQVVLALTALFINRKRDGLPPVVTQVARSPAPAPG